MENPKQLWREIPIPQKCCHSLQLPADVQFTYTRCIAKMCTLACCTWHYHNMWKIHSSDPALLWREILVRVTATVGYGCEPIRL